MRVIKKYYKVMDLKLQNLYFIKVAVDFPVI